MCGGVSAPLMSGRSVRKCADWMRWPMYALPVVQPAAVLVPSSMLAM